MLEQLGDILVDIESIEDKIGGTYFLLIPCEETDIQYQRKSSTKCTIVFMPMNQSEISYLDQGLCELIDLQTAQDIVNNAKQQRPNCSKDELVMALDFYILNDAFYVFE